MKRIIALFTIISFILSSFVFCVPAYAQSQSESYADDMSILSSLNIFTALPKSENAIVTRGMFISGVTELIGAEGSFNKNQSPFYDVTSSDKYYNQIVLAAQLGIIHGDEDRNFRPNDPITYTEAVVMLINGLNYSAEYPNGYYQLANRLKITRGLDVGYSDNITAGICAKLFLNASEAPVFAYGTNNKNEYIEYDENVLWDRHKIAKANGTLEKNEFTSLTSDNGCSENKVVINGATYTLSDYAKSYDFIGHNVEVYYKSENNQAVILHIADYDTTIKTVNADDILELDGKDIIYEDKNTKKRISIPKSASIIYNGVLTLGDKDENGNSIFMPHTGKIDFIDNNSDGAYEVVAITSLTTAVVGQVDAENKVVNDFYYPKRKLDFGEAARNGYEWNITDADGNIVEPSKLTEDSVISYSLSLNQKVLRGIVSTKTEKGTITAQRTSEGDKYVSINGIEYKYNTDFLNSGNALPKLDDTVTVVMDCNGLIAGIQGKATSKAQYGFYIKCSVKQEGLTKKAYAKIMDTVGKGGTQEFEFADSVTIDGEKYDDKTYKTGTNYNLYDYLTVPADYTRTKQYISNENKDCLEPFQVVVYKTNSEGKISYIDTSRRGAKEDENTLTVLNEQRNYNYTSSGQHFYYNSAGDVYNIVAIGTDTKIILTPEYNDIDNYYGYRLVKQNEIITNGRQGFQITAYTTNPHSFVPEMIHLPYLYREEAIFNSSSALIKDISQAVTPEGEDTYLVDYCSDTREYSYYADSSLDLSDIKVGDVVKLELGSDNKITAIKKQCEYNESTKTISFVDSALATSNTHGGTAQDYIAYNYEATGTTITMLKNKGGDLSTSNIDTIPIINVYAGIYVVTPGRNTPSVKKITIDDMKKVSNYKDGLNDVAVYVHLTQAVPRMVVFYEVD